MDSRIKKGMLIIGIIVALSLISHELRSTVKALKVASGEVQTLDSASNNSVVKIKMI